MSKNDFEIPFLGLYVDDIIACVPKNKIDYCIRTLNEMDEHLKFTFEVEVDNKIPFLDLLLVRENGRIEFDYYWKPMSSRRVLNYLSHHPLCLYVQRVDESLANSLGNVHRKSKKDYRGKNS